MQTNTPEGILYVFRGRFVQQNAEDVSLDGGFICPFGDNTLQVLSARLKLNFCIPNRNRIDPSGYCHHNGYMTRNYRRTTKNTA